jgi:hypothetical protein
VSVLDHVVTFVEACEQPAIEVDGPVPVSDLLQADVVLSEGIGDEQQSVLEAERASVGDARRRLLGLAIRRRPVFGRLGPNELVAIRPAIGRVDSVPGALGSMR